MSAEPMELIGVGLYTVREAARLVKTRTDNVKRWVEGREYEHRDGIRRSPRIITPALDPVDGRRILTFVNLIELKFVAIFRDAGVSMPTIRAAAGEAARILDTDHPFARCKFRTDGKDVFAILERRDTAPEGITHRRFIEELRTTNMVFEDFIEPFLDNQIRWDPVEEFAGSWWPLGKDHRVVIDPKRKFGKPIDSETGIPTWALYAATESGESIENIADWYEVPVDAVKQAVEFELSLET